MSDEQPAEPPASPEAKTLGDAIMGRGDFTMSPAMLDMIASATRIEADAQALTEQTRNMIRNSPEARTARAAQSTADSISLLVANAELADQREQRMLYWTKVSAIAAITAAILTAIGIIVTLAVA